MKRYKYSKNLQNEDEIWDAETDTYFKIHGAIKKLNKQNETIQRLEKENQAIQGKVFKLLDWLEKEKEVNRNEIKEWWNG